MVKLEENVVLDKEIVPMPPSHRGARGRHFKYPFTDLDCGQSFFVKGMETRRLGGSIAHAQKKLGYRFAVRSMDGGARVWRVN